MSNSLTNRVRELFLPIKGVNLIIAVGNPYRFDDGVSQYIAARLSRRGRLVVIDAEYSPENIIDEACALKPSNIVIIDAADFSGAPGEVRVIAKEHISDFTLSTHTVPLGAVARILADETGAPVRFLGIQPKNVSFGEGLSAEVKSAADEIISGINEVFSDA